MPKIYLVRHAESVANTRGIYQGQTYDTDLSDLGISQTKALAEAVKDFRVNQIICSPLIRTFYTALECAKTSKIPMETDTKILETNHGLWEGKNKEWIEKNYPREYETWRTNPKEVHFPEGERFCDTVERVRNFLLRRNWRENTLIVTHDNIVRTMLLLIEDRPLDDLWDYEIHPTGISVLSVSGSNGSTQFEIEAINMTEHLDKLVSNISEHAL